MFRFDIVIHVQRTRMRFYLKYLKYDPKYDTETDGNDIWIVIY